MPVLRVESGLFFANAEAVRLAIKQHAARAGTAGVVLDAETVGFVYVTAVRMLDEMGDELAPAHQQLVIAHDLGQVDDLLAQHPDVSVQVRPSIPAAIAAITSAAATGSS